MSHVVRASVVLAVAVCLVTVLIAVTGLHEKPVFGIVALVLFIGLNIGAVYWALAQTASTNGYGKQLGNAALVGLIGGALIFVGSFVLTSFVFPNYIKEMGDASLDAMEGWGVPKEVLDKAAADVAKQTPVGEAFKGLIGTFLTSVVVGAIVAIFKRQKRAAA